MKKLFPNEEIIKTKNFDVHQDWEIPIPGFFIAASVKPHRSIMDFGDDELQEFIKLVQLVRRGMQEVLNIKDVYFFQREDAEYSFHFWIFPRHDWMEKFGKRIQSIKPIIEYAKKNMVNDEVLKEIKTMTKKMNAWMKKNWQEN